MSVGGGDQLTHALNQLYQMALGGKPKIPHSYTCYRGAAEQEDTIIPSTTLPCKNKTR